MIFDRIKIKNFRNIENIETELHRETNVIFGENAQGKTNILEALWCFTGGKSFRGAKDGEMIRFGTEKAEICLDFNDDGRDQNCIVKITNKRSAVFNGVEYPSASGIAGKIKMIIFSPSDLSVIKDGPTFRRKFIDSAICQLYPAYIDTYRRYIRALDQRNKILKEIKFDPGLEEFIEDYEDQLSLYGSEIAEYRKKYVLSLCEFLPDIYGGIASGKEKITLSYESSAGSTKEEFKENLKLSRNEDVKTLTTSIGPHRDDLDIKIDGISARSFGSQGQKRSAALALKLSESRVIEKLTGSEPAALLDDVMSELDPVRQNYILNHIKDRQVFITCCDPDNIKGLKAGKVIEISGGKILSKRN